MPTAVFICIVYISKQQTFPYTTLTNLFMAFFTKWNASYYD